MIRLINLEQLRLRRRVQPAGTQDRAVPLWRDGFALRFGRRVLIVVRPPREGVRACRYRLADDQPTIRL